MKNILRRLLVLSFLLLLLGICSGCEYTTDPGFDYLTPKPPTPTNTLTPTTAPPTSTPTPSPSPEPTMTPVPDMDYVEGDANACATWDNGDLVEAAPVIVGELVYKNNFEYDSKCYYPKRNAWSADRTYVNDLYHSGNTSVEISNRKEGTHGISGAGFYFSDENGLNYEELVGHTLEVHVFIYYKDELFGTSDTITFAFYDCYRTERVMGYTYNKNNDIIVDDNGEPVLKEQDAFPVVATYDVPIGEWTECVFTFTVQETKLGPEDGTFLLATQNETANSLGLYTSFYFDDMTIRVLD